MSTITTVNIKDFAERVERLCDFLLDKVEKDGSDDVIELQDLKKDAADIQFITTNKHVSIDGLHSYIHGHPQKST